MLLAPGAQLRLRQVFVRLAVGVPEFQHAEKLRRGIGENGMGVVGGLACIGRAFARILDAQEGCDHQHLAQHAVLARRDQHARQLRIDRKPGHLAADRRQAAIVALARGDGAEFG